ncbi:hypothetical protein DB354_14205 [Opitutus sp. ER46]|nr:hypothetical protein DB354_14205 [Opitutus sp. ER46]
MLLNLGRAGLLLLTLSAARALEPTNWANRQPFLLGQPGLTRVALPPATLDAARPDRGDLRLLDPTGRETAFLLWSAPPPLPSPARAPHSFQATLRDNHTQLLIETGTSAPLTGLTLRTPADGFIKGALLERSDDGVQWSPLRSGAPLFRQHGAELLTLPLAGVSTAWLRVTLDDTRNTPVPFLGATLCVAVPQAPDSTRELPDVGLTQREEFAGVTVLTLDLGARHLPLAELQFDIGDALFTRRVKVAVRELRNEVATERVLAQGVIFRLGVGGAATAAELSVPLDLDAPARELLVYVENGDSPPLEIRGVRVRHRPVWLVFAAPLAGTYNLLTGNPNVPAPHYDLARLPRDLPEIPDTAAEPGTLRPMPGHTPRDPLAAAPLRGGVIDVSAWQFRKPVQFAGDAVQQLEIDLDVLAGTRNQLADVRLVRDGEQVPYLVERPALARALPLPFQPVERRGEPTFSRWRVPLPRARLPLSTLTLTSTSPLFTRYLRVYETASDDRGGWRDRVLADGTWNRTPDGGANLVLTFVSHPSQDELWIETNNGDNPPIVLSAVQAEYPVTRLLFRAEPGPLMLYYGNPGAATPRYDLALLAEPLLRADRQRAQPGPEEVLNPDGWATRAVGRSGLVFWSVLAGVVVVLLIVVARLLPKPPPTVAPPS